MSAYVSDEHVASIFRAEKHTKGETAQSRQLRACSKPQLSQPEIYIYIYLIAIGLLPGGSVYKRTYIQQGNHTYISRHHTAQHK
jgi:hypothetical protein